MAKALNQSQAAQLPGQRLVQLEITIQIRLKMLSIGYSQLANEAFHMITNLFDKHLLPHLRVPRGMGWKSQ